MDALCETLKLQVICLDRDTWYLHTYLYTSEGSLVLSTMFCSMFYGRYFGARIFSGAESLVYFVVRGRYLTHLVLLTYCTASACDTR